MANFPTSLDTLSNPTGADITENSNPFLDHDYQHSTANDILEALEAKVGIDGSAVTTSFDYKLSAVTGTSKATPQDTNGNVTANNVLQGYTTTATSGGTTTLTNASTFYQRFTGSTTQTIVMPVASTLVLGQEFWIANGGSGILTIQSSGGNTITTLGPTSALGQTFIRLVCILTSGTTASSWAFSMPACYGSSGKMLEVRNNISLAGTDNTLMTFPGTSDTVVGLNVAQAPTNKDLSSATNTFPSFLRVINKTSDQSVTNSATLVSDSILQWAVVSGTTYYFRFDLLVTNSNDAGPDWKSAILAPASSTGNVVLSGVEPAGASFPQAVQTDVTTPGTLVNPAIVADANIPFNVTLQGWVTAGGNGTLALQFAQNTATVGIALTVLKGSRVTYSY